MKKSKPCPFEKYCLHTVLRGNFLDLFWDPVCSYGKFAIRHLDLTFLQIFPNLQQLGRRLSLMIRIRPHIPFPVGNLRLLLLPVEVVLWACRKGACQQVKQHDIGYNSALSYLSHSSI